MAVDVVDGVARIAGTDDDRRQHHHDGPAVPAGRARVGRGGAGRPTRPWLHAVRQTAANPARVLGRTDIGSLETGRRADFVVLDADLRVAGVVVGGSPSRAGPPPTIGRRRPRSADEHVNMP